MLERQKKSFPRSFALRGMCIGRTHFTVVGLGDAR